MRKRDLTGQSFGRLFLNSRIVLRSSTGRSISAYNCSCSCGNTKVIRHANIVAGTQSCGCVHSEGLSKRSKKHGLSGSPEFVSWCAMKSRVQNTSNKRYIRYGARGVTICKRWLDFSSFLEDLGPKPSPRHSLERLDNDGNYEPGNCIWATPETQAKNRSNNSKITYRGKTMTIMDWSREVGVKRATISYRMRRGYLVDEIFGERKYIRRNNIG